MKTEIVSVLILLIVISIILVWWIIAWIKDKDSWGMLMAIPILLTLLIIWVICGDMVYSQTAPPHPYQKEDTSTVLKNNVTDPSW